MNNIKSYIFESCISLFPELESGLKTSGEQKKDFNAVAFCDNESDLHLDCTDYDLLKGQFLVQMYTEVNLVNKICKHPKFELLLDFTEQRAEVLNFESYLFPHTRLDVYTEVEGEIKTNVVAQRDLETLCANWFKQLNELNYRPQWEVISKQTG